MKNTSHRERYRIGLSSGKLFAIAAVVFTSAIAVGTASTYAWYSISEQFRIVGFEMQIHHDETLFKLGKMEENGEISYQEDKPYSLKDLGVKNPTVGNVSNMCVGDYPTTYDPDFKPFFSSGYVPGGATRATERASDPNADPDKATYVQFELYAYCEYDAFLYLTPDTKAVANEQANSETAQRKGLDARELDNVVNAARISFYTSYGYTIVELGEHEDVTYSGLLDVSGNGYYDTDNDSKEIVYGIYDGSPSYEATPLPSDQDDYEKHDTFRAAHMAGARKWDSSKEYGAIKENAHPVSYYALDSEGEAYPKPTPIGVAKAKTPTRIVCSVFIEGWDHDMTNSLIEASFGLSLGFVAEFNPDAKQYL